MPFGAQIFEVKNERTEKFKISAFAESAMATDMEEIEFFIWIAY